VTPSPNTLTACEAAARIAAGELQSEALVRACLNRIALREPELRAWAHIDADGALHAAREADKIRQSNACLLGPLHGIPVGIKDVIATKALRTEYNSEIYVGHQTQVDAAAVTMLRAAGAVIIGKTETVEFAAWGGRVAPTGNPRDTTRTPGGSSSGSAAAVADDMVPIALGTQTGGSVIRPASFCGVVGFKPTFGAVSTEGIKRYAATLDTLGWYARSVEDVALLARVFDVSDDPIPAPPSPEMLRIGICRTPYWEAARPETQAALAEAGRRLSDGGAVVTDLTLGAEFSVLNEIRQTVMWAEGRVSFLDLHHIVPNKISPGIRKSMERIGNKRLCAALDHAATLRPVFDASARAFDAVITPSAPGEAPVGLAFTGDSIFNGLWTLLHVPCINLPGLTGPQGLPVGIQLVGARYADAHLLAVAQTVVGLLDRSDR
jgi:Asp-tRNA(Asn)/Glu-tRNA(Gln) amidotransferase A subunit family amidase